jgi:hypothetical protein
MGRIAVGFLVLSAAGILCRMHSRDNLAKLRIPIKKP